MVPAGWPGQAVQMERVELLLPRTAFAHLWVWGLNPFWCTLPITHLPNSESLRSSVFSPCWLTSCQVFRKRPKSCMHRKRHVAVLVILLLVLGKLGFFSLHRKSKLLCALVATGWWAPPALHLRAIPALLWAAVQAEGLCSASPSAWAVTAELNGCPPISLDVHYTTSLDIIFSLILETLWNKWQSIVGLSAFRCGVHMQVHQKLDFMQTFLHTNCLTRGKQGAAWIDLDLQQSPVQPGFQVHIWDVLLLPKWWHIKYKIRNQSSQWKWSQSVLYLGVINNKNPNSLKWKLLFTPSDHRRSWVGLWKLEVVWSLSMLS